MLFIHKQQYPCLFFIIYYYRSVVSYKTLTKPLVSFDTLNAASGGQLLENIIKLLFLIL